MIIASQGPQKLFFFFFFVFLCSGGKKKGKKKFLGLWGAKKKGKKRILGALGGYNHRVKEAQIYLVNAGFNPGLIDGAMDRSTRNAIMNFQKANNLKVTGFIDFKTWRNLSEYKKAGKAVLDKKDQVKYYSSSSEGVKDI